MSAGTPRPLWATGISVAVHGAALAALVWWVAPIPPAPPPVMPQIELLPPLPVVPAPQEAQPTPIDLPIEPKPAPPAAYAPPLPLPDPPPVIEAQAPEIVQPIPPKPPPKPRRKEPVRPQPIPIKAVERAEAPPAATAVNGNETKKDTVVAELPAPAQPAGPPPDYIGLIRARLEQVKRYPPEARLDRQEGVVMMRFSLDRSGQVLASGLVRSSGIAALDKEAAAMIGRAAPFPPFPPSIDGSTLDLVVPIEFSLHHS